jgi:hypothetical protein
VDGVVGHSFESDPPKDHPCKVCFSSVQGFQRTKFKCESLRRTTNSLTDERTPMDDGHQVMAYFSFKRRDTVV